VGRFVAVSCATAVYTVLSPLYRNLHDRTGNATRCVIVRYYAVVVLNRSIFGHAVACRTVFVLTDRNASPVRRCPDGTCSFARVHSAAITVCFITLAPASHSFFTSVAPRHVGQSIGRCSYAHYLWFLSLGKFMF